MGKALEKFAFSVTDDGHKWDAKVYKAVADMQGKASDASKEYEGKRPFLADMAGIGSRFNDLNKNKADYLAAKHEGKENNYNPFAGLSSDAAKKQREKNKAK